MTAAPPSRSPLPHQRLRAATQASHDRVDRSYARFDLTDAESYAEFLLAHARVLPAVEQRLAAHPDLPAFAPRAPALAADLTALGRAMPAHAAVPAFPSVAAAWAALYVVEGSRLGGVMLARQVGAGLPQSYLAAGHDRGGWRTLLAGYDAAAGGDDWDAEAIPAARRVFDLYAESAAG